MEVNYMGGRRIKEKGMWVGEERRDVCSLVQCSSQ